MKRLLKRVLVILAVGAALLIAGVALQMLALNRQAQRLIEQSDRLVVGLAKAEVFARMPGDLLVSTNPPSAEDVAETKRAVSALRYNAPVLLNSVYVSLLFDENDQLIARKRLD